MMIVDAVQDLQMKIHHRSVRHGVEKFPDHFGVQFSNLLHGIVGILIQIGAAGQINGTHCQSLIHRQQKTSIPLNPCFISQSL